MNIDQFQQLPLWQQLIAKAGHAEIAMIEKHVQYILPRMESYVNTFPTYTLHNREHIFNVMRIMGDLLGDQINKLSGLEAAVLILSATYHDFGMIFSEEEHKEISGYENLQVLIDAGVSGINIEDAQGIDVYFKKLNSIAAYLKNTGQQLFINARTDVFL